jgi:hypothetical protein
MEEGNIQSEERRREAEGTRGVRVGRDGEMEEAEEGQ